MLQIAIANEQACLRFDADQLRAGVEAVLREANLQHAEISLAIVNDERIHQLNRQFLQHDYPTDVISFVLEQSEERLEGEIVASAETATAMAGRSNWPAEHELLLYLVHGALHLIGYDDLTPELAAEMRQAERRILEQLGITLPAGYGQPVAVD